MGWLPPSSDGIAMCQDRGVERHTSGEDGEMRDTVSGVDLAMCVSQFHGATMMGEVKCHKKPTSEQLRAFMVAQTATLVVFESCGSTSY